MTNAAAPRLVKCVVWDIDNTLLDGIFLESGDTPPAANPAMAGALSDLASRGILHAIASKNPPQAAAHAAAVTGARYGNFRSLATADVPGRGTIAELLMAAVVQAAAQAGYTHLTGKTHTSNLGMRALYRKFGFEAAHITMEWRASAGDAAGAGTERAEAEGAGGAAPGGPGGGGGR